MIDEQVAEFMCLLGVALGDDASTVEHEWSPKTRQLILRVIMPDKGDDAHWWEGGVSMIELENPKQSIPPIVNVIKGVVRDKRGEGKT